MASKEQFRYFEVAYVSSKRIASAISVWYSSQTIPPDLGLQRPRECGSLQGPG